ncbi:hypothetical protein IE4872_PD01513 (plasmid) [Rhizobium gallicum]|uniref:Uncharacterized protein n=1 Tax=Rhizobium gallicum TaxID=56730 RepID=A0A1L5NVY3_9HYPH|nr:hypothetical protein IE4872_PD01513 [Rhizobium gallicum]
MRTSWSSLTIRRQCPHPRPWLPDARVIKDGARKCRDAIEEIDVNNAVLAPALPSTSDPALRKSRLLRQSRFPKSLYIPSTIVQSSERWEYIGKI